MPRAEDPTSGLSEPVEETSRSDPSPDAAEVAQPTSPVTPDRSGPDVVSPRTDRWARRVGIALVVVLAGVSIFFAGFTLGAHVATTPGTPASLEQEFSPFWDVFNQIKERYAGSPRPTDEQLIVGAIKGMLSSLNDPWSFYQPPDDFKASEQRVGGRQEGIGVVVEMRPRPGQQGPCTGSDVVGPKCELAIVKPIPDSPADKAGLLADDVIAAVDGKPVDGLTVDKITALIRGKEGTPVTLTIRRGATTTDHKIVRATFQVPQVDTKVLANGAVEYIHVSGINSQGQAAFHAALQAALAAGRRSIVVDLRDNAGGYVDSAVAMTSEFLSSGVVMYQRDASGAEFPTNVSSGGLATDPGIRVVVLVNRNTASAAEIFAGALQGNGRAKLIGEKTYGKGVAQVWEPLDNNLGGFHLTVAQWLTPKHVWINGRGLQPDVAVSSDNAPAGTDPVLDAALAELASPSSAPAASPSPAASSTPSPAASVTP